MAWKTWTSLTTEDFAALDPARSVALLPLGAVEQHGPHLPLGTDAILSRAIRRRAYELLPEDCLLLELPAQEVGDSLEHRAFPGTLSLPAEVLIAAWTALGESVARAGLKKLILFNSHGGQPQVLDIVAQRLRADHALLAVRANSFRFGLPEGLVDAEEQRFGFHAGDVESSMMLAAAGELVRREHLADFRQLGQEMAEDFRALGPEGPLAGFAWQSEDLHPSGASGNAAAANREKGEALLEHLARQLAHVIEEAVRFPLERLGG